jgi:hypothetical protein
MCASNHNPDRGDPGTPLSRSWFPLLLADHHHTEYGEHYKYDDDYPDQTKHECDLPNVRVITFDNVALAIIDYRPMSAHTGTQHADDGEHGSDGGNDH